MSSNPEEPFNADSVIKKRSFINRYLPFILFAGLLLYVGFQYWKFRVAPPLKISELSITDLEGHKVSLNDYRGKPLFINFFGTWCRECIAEMPDLQRMNQSLQDKGLQVILVSEEEPVRLRDYREKSLNPLPLFYSDSEFDKLGIHTYPTSYLLNARGEIVYKTTNAQDWSSDEMIEKLRKLINS